MKSQGQIEGVAAKHFKWERMSEDIGEWKKKYPQESDLLWKEIWGNKNIKKIPILYGKKGKLQMINPLRLNYFSSLPGEYPEVLPAHFRTHFEKPLKEELDLLNVYEEWSMSVREMTKSCQNGEWTFLYQNEMEILENKLQQYNSITEEVKTWSKKNKENIFYKKSNKSISQDGLKIIQRYKEHVSVCKEKELSLVQNTINTITCTHCKSVWEYNKQTKTVDIVQSLREERKPVEQALLHYKNRKEKGIELQELGISLQKTYSHLQQDEELEILKKDLLRIQQAANQEDTVMDGVEETVQTISNLIQVKEILFHRFQTDVLQLCDIDGLQNDLKKIIDNLKLPKTKQTFKRWITKWKTFRDEKETEWETYRKNIVKHLPTSYTFRNITLSMNEVKACLLALQQLDGFYGFHLVADMLKGSKQKKIYEFSLQKQSQYGLLQRLKKDDVLDVLLWFQRKDWLVQKGRDYPKIHITKKGLQQLQRMEQKKTLLEKDEDVLHHEKQKFLSQKLEKFLDSLTIVIAFEEWKEEYLLQSYEKEGVPFYKKILQYYRESKNENVLLETFLQKNYEEKYRPIYMFYEKTSKSGNFHTFLQTMISQKEKVR